MSAAKRFEVREEPGAFGTGYGIYDTVQKADVRWCGRGAGAKKKAAELCRRLNDGRTTLGSVPR